MLALARGARSLLSLSLVGLAFLPGSLVLRVFVIPAAWLFPERRIALASAYMRGMSRVILALLTLGGARFRRSGTIPTASPALVVGNHQALIDILQIAILSRPFVPAFVARKRYARFVPLVSATMKLLGCPIVDPKRDAAAAVEAIRRGVNDLKGGIIIFPEGHRTLDGEIRPFRTTGVETILETKALPVYLVLNDGVWRVRRFADLLFRAHLVDAVSEVMGPFDPPTDPAARHAFVHGLRERLAARLAELRRQRPAADPHGAPSRDR